MRFSPCVLLGGLLYSLANAQTTPVSVTVAPERRQTFAGLGAGVGNWGLDYQKLTPAEREKLSKLLWGDLHMTSIRLWINLNEYAPARGQKLTKNFRDRYLSSHLLADAQKQGVKEILLAPDNAPVWMKSSRPGGANDFVLKDEALVDYANLIADFIEQIRDETGVTFTATGIQNEPNDLDRVTPAQFPVIVKALRAALDARGLKEVKIIAPEAANVDGIYFDTIDQLKADPAAWAALGGLAFHAYSMAATEQAAGQLAGKPFWMTEASANGPETPGDAQRAASLAARFLSDMNHRATHWQHFLAFETPDPNDNATRIIAYTPAPLRTTVFQKYHAYHQLVRAFGVGAVFRKSASDLDGDMTWTYGKKPRLFAAAARNPDGTWGVGVANFTASHFNDDPTEAAGSDNGYKAKTFDVTVALPLDKDADFVVTRTPAGADAKPETVHSQAGKLRLTVGPLQVVTARSAPQ